jgi:hypothetical protein
MYKVISTMVKSIIDSIQTTGISSVKVMVNKVESVATSLKSHTFHVKTVNPQKELSVKGEVKVTNPVSLSETNSLIKNLASAFIEFKFPDQIKVTNFPEAKPFPKEIKVSNLSSKTEVVNLNVLVDELGKLQKVVKGLDIRPVVNIPETKPPVVNIPETKPPIVNVHEKEVDLSGIKQLSELIESLTVSAKKSLSVRLSDGKSFYQALERMGDIYASSNSSGFQYVDGGEARPVVNRNHELQVTTSETWDFNDSDKFSTAVTYFGEESVVGKWRVRKVIKNGTITSVRHATQRNNPTVLDYDSAWGNRVDLTYELASKAL